MNKEQLFRKLYDNAIARDNYTDRIPSDIRAVVCCNQYTENLLYDRSMLLEAAFGEHTQSVEWFLDEWFPGYECGYEGNLVEIWNIDQYIQWMKDNEGFQ
jgi:hypothetical protein